MPGNIAKGPILERFDAFINQSAANLSAALTQYTTKLDIGLAIEWAADPSRNLLTPAEVKHIVTHWFPEEAAPPPTEPPFWNTLRPMGEVVRRGLVRALELCLRDEGGGARPQPLPLDSYWICAGSHFEVVVTLGRTVDAGANPVDHHVNLLILTPSVPVSRHDAPLSGFPDKEKIWVVKHSDVEPGALEVDTSPDGRVVTMQLRKG
jgi:hypothetical protein